MLYTSNTALDLRQMFTLIDRMFLIYKESTLFYAGIISIKCAEAINI